MISDAARSVLSAARSTMNMHNKIKEKMAEVDELRVRRAVLLHKQALELGEIDQPLNKLYAELSSLISLLPA